MVLTELQNLSICKILETLQKTQGKLRARASLLHISPSPTAPMQPLPTSMRQGLHG